MQKASIVISCSVLLIYYIFTSGLVYEVTQSNVTNRFDVPYSIGLSAERTGISTIYYSDDMECAKWFTENWDGKTMIISDYNGARVLNAEMGMLQGDGYLWGIIEIPWKEKFLKKCYIFKTTWNTEHNQYIFGTSPGLRQLYSWPECNYPIVFQSGKSIIYKTF